MLKNKKIKALLLSLVSVSVLGTTSCGLSRQEIVARAAQGAIAASIGYLTPITPAQENQIGAQVIREVATQYKEYTGNKELVNYVRSVADKVFAQASRRNEINYQVYIVDSPEVNAFTIPGGAIFITTELLKYLKNEAELVSVLAHEVGHNENKHPVETIKRAMAAQGLAQGALSSNDNALIQLLAQVSLDLILKGFSREQEKESDQTSAVILAKMNYDTDSLSGFLKTLLTLSKDPNGFVKLFYTHPGSQERIDNLNRFIASKHIQNSSGITNENTFKKYTSVLPPKIALKK
ncbi:MAG: M48 family metalloprotease [Candidatus Sericytochromatia bacterium]